MQCHKKHLKVVNIHAPLNQSSCMLKYKIISGPIVIQHEWGPHLLLNIVYVQVYISILGCIYTHTHKLPISVVLHSHGKPKNSPKNDTKKHPKPRTTIL